MLLEEFDGPRKQVIRVYEVQERGGREDRRERSKALGSVLRDLGIESIFPKSKAFKCKALSPVLDITFSQGIREGIFA